MRRRRPVAFAGFLVVVLGAVIGFASFSAESPRSEHVSIQEPGPTPSVISGRLTAAILSSRLDPPQLTPDSTPPLANTAPRERVSSEVPGNAVPSLPDSVPSTQTPRPAQPTTTRGATTTTHPPAPTIPVTKPPIVFPDSVERWRPLVATYFPPSLLGEALSVMECESRGDPDARNPGSTASGLYQFLSSTWSWASGNAGFLGVSVHDPEANIATAAHLVEYSIDRGLPAWQHWVCQPDLPS